MQPSKQIKRPATRLRRGSHSVHLPTPSPLPPTLGPQPVAQRPYRLAQCVPQQPRTVVRVGDALIGGSQPVVIGGPCSVENEEQVLATAEAVRAAGGQILRGGAFKPRTSPYAFSGLGEEGLRLLALAGAHTGLPVVTEVIEPADVELVARYADMLQIGSRNMQNYPLLRAVGRTRMPVLLKRGLAASIEEWLLAAEYILAEGNNAVVLCERGVRGIDATLRNQLDLSAVPLLRELTHLPVIVDPSHATGRRSLIQPVSLAAIAAGAAGLIIEVHPNPDQALSDAAQTVDFEQFTAIMQAVRAVAAATASYYM
ncbi:MAG: 3-deoxy-7-phosphoheptulonate synthase [Chloroflexi bacterium]|jgi:3-deoxy-7-phosphoheptulonate synthase|nr:3-deoxy-7-phosphoheptulonate synthase [Chloroflexota bacterium]